MIRVVVIRINFVATIISVISSIIIICIIIINHCYCYCYGQTMARLDSYGTATICTRDVPGWPETRLAQNTLNDIKLAYITLTNNNT